MTTRTAFIETAKEVPGTSGELKKLSIPADIADALTMPDKDELITEEWLRSVGFRDEGGSGLRITSGETGAYHHLRHTGVFINTRGNWMCWANGIGCKTCSTRLDVRLLCITLGVALNPQENRPSQMTTKQFSDEAMQQAAIIYSENVHSPELAEICRQWLTELQKLREIETMLDAAKVFGWEGEPNSTIPKMVEMLIGQRDASWKALSACQELNCELIKSRTP